MGAGLRDVLGVDDAIGSPADEAPIAITRAQLAELLPAIAGSDRLLARAGKVRLLVAHGDGFVARSPALVQLVADAGAAGGSAAAALDLASAVTDAADATGVRRVALSGGWQDGCIAIANLPTSPGR